MSRDVGAMRVVCESHLIVKSIGGRRLKVFTLFPQLQLTMAPDGTESDISIKEIQRLLRVWPL
jgi:hypothetical protein